MARGLLRIEGPSGEEPAGQVNKALAAFGLEAEEALELEEEFALWPENLEVFNLWLAVKTQWRICDRRGATGLDYQGVKACMSMRGISKKKRTEVFAGLQVMEWAALDEWASEK